MKKINNKNSKAGLSIIETLIAVVVFALLAAVAAQSIALSLRGARKSDSLSEVRENMDFAVSIIERQLRNSRGIISNCTGSSSSSIQFEDADEQPTEIACQSIGTNGYIENDSGRMTNDQVSITQCQFTCTQQSAATPPVVNLRLTGSRKGAPAGEESNIVIDTDIRLRVY